MTGTTTVAQKHCLRRRLLCSCCGVLCILLSSLGFTSGEPRKESWLRFPVHSNSNCTLVLLLVLLLLLLLLLLLSADLRRSQITLLLSRVTMAVVRWSTGWANSSRWWSGCL